MKLHKEGYKLILFSLLIMVLIDLSIGFLFGVGMIFSVFSFVFLLLFGLILWFFRVPPRINPGDPGIFYSPCDGKVVVIEEVFENEYFNDKRIQVSIFMSPLNVHINWYPIGGVVKYCKYHPGKFLVAWHPKSSTENERSTVVLETRSGKKILVRQIAGAVARRIVTYSRPEMNVNADDELGFIKFGSRVDIFIPLDSKIKVKLNEKVKGCLSEIACI